MCEYVYLSVYLCEWDFRAASFPGLSGKTRHYAVFIFCVCPFYNPIECSATIDVVWISFSTLYKNMLPPVWLALFALEFYNLSIDNSQIRFWVPYNYCYLEVNSLFITDMARLAVLTAGI